MAWGPQLPRQNSLDTTITRYNNSPTLSRSYEHQARRKSCNLVENKGESPLPKINEKAPEEPPVAPQSPSVTIMRKFLIFIEPKGFMKERDEFSLYLFTPNNRYGNE